MVLGEEPFGGSHGVVVMVMIIETKQLVTGTVPIRLIATTGIHDYDGIPMRRKVLGKPFQLGRTAFCTGRNPYSTLNVGTFLLKGLSLAMMELVSSIKGGVIQSVSLVGRPQGLDAAHVTIVARNFQKGPFLRG